MRYTYMLAFLLAVVVLLSLMFRYVTGVRLVLLLPDITALSVALLVNARPGLEWNCTLFRGNRAGVCGTMDAHGCKGG